MIAVFYRTVGFNSGAAAFLREPHTEHWLRVVNFMALRLIRYYKNYQTPA